ncbi:Phage-related baseplate assembly protein [Planctomycetes bacterium Pan216]|uniref:Phage-related baseplate assembly protein n=1 Tax=Kolteria novifilia TaxID=2527975 RepID=A0A518B2R6_9BACT|nr:Phage-related baseplate assembly protein [Planctomycetes bacterium Pan216]
MPDSTFLVRRLHGTEPVSNLFRFELELVTKKETEVAFDAVLGQSATLDLDVGGPSTRHVNGIISEFARVDMGVKWTSYRAVIVPRLWLLTKDRRSRVFQQLSVVDVVEQVLGEASVDVRAELSDTYVAKNYCVQYRESTFRFLQRILEEHGIFFGWKHEKDSHQLVLWDDVSRAAKVAGDSWTFHPIKGGIAKKGTIHTWRVHQQIAAGNYSVRDLAFQLRDQVVGAINPLLENAAVGNEQHKLLSGTNRGIEVREHSPQFAQWFDDVGPNGDDQSDQMGAIYAEGTRAAKLMMERHASESLWIEGTSNVPVLTSGHLLKTKKVPAGDGSFLVTSVLHEANQPIGVDDESESFWYRNQFRCRPSTLPFRPALTTAKPNVGPEAAVVEGPREGHPHIDKHGRVRVRFSWSDDLEETSSCWLRVGHPWAGKNRGHVHFPRVGDEVVVNFYQHDPDRPYVDGSMHNATNTHPRDVPENSQQTVFRSGGLSDSAEYTGIAMDDQVSHLQMFSSSDMSQSLGGDFYHNTSGAHQANIGSYHAKYVGSTIAKEVNPDKSQSQTSRSNRKSATSRSSAEVVRGKIRAAAAKQGLSQHLSSGASGATSSGPTTSSGRGSEGGPADWPSDDGDSAFDEIATDSELIWGMKEEGVVGFWEELTVGIHNANFFNPIGLFYIGSGASASATAATELVDPFSALFAVQCQGNLSNVFGTTNALIYGPAIKTIHGPRIDFKAGSGVLYNTNSACIAAAVFALLYLVFTILQRVANYWMDHKDGGDYSSSRFDKAMWLEVGHIECLNVCQLLETTGYFVYDTQAMAGSYVTTFTDAVASLFVATGTYAATKWSELLAWVIANLCWIVVALVIAVSAIVIVLTYEFA